MRERLYRSRDDRMLFGVAGGMADWLDLDPAVVRLVWALLILAGGVGLLLYIVAAIVIPESPYAIGPAMAQRGSAVAPLETASAAAGASEQARWEARRARRAARRGGGNPAVIFGLILVVLGSWFLLDRYVKDLDLGWFMPGALIVIGLVLVVGAIGRSNRTDG